MSTIVSYRAFAVLRSTCRSVLIGALALPFAACDSGSSSADRDKPPTTNPPTPSMYLISGAVSGLIGSGLVLRNDGGDDLAIAADASEFAFATKIAAGGAYKVTVVAQPVGQTCTVGHGAGTNVAADVDNIKVVCNVDAYTLSASITGLSTSGLVLQNNGADDLAVSAYATRAGFGIPVAHGGSYNVTVLTQPTGLLCSVTNGTGSHVAANVANVEVACSAATVTIGGTVSGLTDFLVLQNNGGDDTVVPPNGATFEFHAPVAFGGGYNVTVLTQPIGATCTVNNGIGSNVTAAVVDIGIVCSADTFDIGGTVSGLIDSGLVLRNNGADDLPVAANATSFQFATPVAYGGNYSATVQQQPVSQTCVVANGSGSNVGNHVANIAVTCSVNTYTVGGSVSGYGSSGLVLQNNGTDDAAIPVSGSFTFPTPIADGAVYNVTVLAQPTGETCSVSNGSGTMSSANVTNVQVSCAPSITITNISPASGPEIGGTTVVINGTNFASLTDVYFGGVPASFMVLNSSMLSAVAPAGIGVVDITLVGTDSSATVVSGYTYDP